jgi:phosphoglycolate phosphatase
MQTLLFDLDGTVSDPLVGISRSINYALTTAGYQPRAESELAKHIGPPLDETFKTLIHGSDAEVRVLVSLYRDRYAEIGFAENTIYPGITTVISQLSRRKIPLGICTSKRGDFAEKILDMFNIREHFGFVSGGDIGVTKRQQIARLLADGAIDLQATMIGDRAVDIVAAHDNGIEAVGVLWGYGSRAELLDQSPRRLLERVEELIELVAA